MNAIAKNGLLDQFERGVRAILGIALLLLAWGFGWTSVEAIGAMLLGLAALATAAAGFSPADRVLSRFESRTDSSRDAT
jgi:glucose-6-phosphate-specific signal transduction histidine kinase